MRGHFATFLAEFLLVLHASAGSSSELCAFDQNAYFDYDPYSPTGPDEWSQISSCCRGERQSPINLRDNKKHSVCNVSFVPLTYQTPVPVEGELYNSGNGLKIAFSDTTKAILSGLTEPYSVNSFMLVNIHIHFNNMSGHGSEHAINDCFYDAEIHLVHYNTKFGDVATAVIQEHGLMVVGIMLEVVELEQQNAVTDLIDQMGYVKGIGKEYSIPISVNPSLLFPASDNFFTYAGSLTTPPCSESVRWVVMQEPRKINKSQLEILVALEGKDGVPISTYSNARPLQKPKPTVETNFVCGESEEFSC